MKKIIIKIAQLINFVFYFMHCLFRPSKTKEKNQFISNVKIDSKVIFKKRLAFAWKLKLNLKWEFKSGKSDPFDG